MSEAGPQGPQLPIPALSTISCPTWEQLQKFGIPTLVRSHGASILSFEKRRPRLPHVDPRGRPESSATQNVPQPWVVLGVQTGTLFMEGESTAGL